MMSTRSPSSVGSARGPDFMQSMERADKRHKKLLMMQKKIQVGDAMQKKMRMERSLSPVKGGRISTPDIIKTVNAELDTMITMDDFQKSTPLKGQRAQSPLFRSPMLRQSPVQHITVSEIQKSPFLREQMDEMERSGKIKRKSTERRRKKRASKVRIGGTAGTSPAAEPRPVSLPNLESPARAASQRSSSVASHQTPEVSRSNASTASRHMPELSQSTKKRHQQAEMMIRQQVRNQAKDLSLTFKRADADGSGELDEDELKSALYRMNIVFEERHFETLMAKIDADGSGTISYKEFMKYFAKGSADDRNLSKKVTGVSVAQAKKMIQESIESRMESGPSGLRRAFQMFDGDGSGSISKQEFIHTLRLHCMLEFETHVINGVLGGIEGDEMGYNEFVAFVMGSTKGDRSSVAPSRVASVQTNDDNGNSEQMIRRKVREHWKSMHTAFKRGDPDKTGKIAADLLEDILGRHDITIPAPLWEQRIGELDPSHSGRVSYSGFLKPYSKGSDFDKKVMNAIKVKSLSVAKRMVREKLEGRIQGGPAGLRRAFQFFDRDGGNSIDREELEKALAEYLGLVFEKDMVDALFADFSGGAKDINFHAFTVNVMGSTSDTNTSLDSRSLRSNAKVRDAVIKGSNDPVFVRRKVREHWKDLQFAFRHADTNGNGIITRKDLRRELERFDIILADSQFDSLVNQIDKDGDGEVSYEEFFSHFAPGQKDEQLDALVGTITESTTSVTQAKELIRDKMRGRLSGGPSELRRTFQMFDRDGGGTIDCKEFETALKSVCGLQFEGKLIQKVMDQFSKGTGEMDFSLFTEAVMDSKTGDSTSIGQHMKASAVTSNDAGNSMQFIIRKVNERFKDLKIAFGHACDKDGFCTPAKLRDVLFRFDIVMSDDGFGDIVKKIDENGDGKIHFTEFMALFGPGSTNAGRGNAISTITTMSVPKAKDLISEKIRGRLAGGPSEMRRAFQFFDRDGGGTIDLDEFAHGLAQFCGLKFSDSILKALMKSWDTDNTGELDYVKFCKAVMGSTGAAAETSFVNDAHARAVASDSQGNSTQFLRRKVRQEMRRLLTDFKHQADKNGNVTPEQLNDILYKHDIIMADKDFAKMITEMDEDGDGELSYSEFLNYFTPGQADEAVVSAVVDNISVTKAIAMIREKVEARLEGGPGGLLRAWRVFDDDKSGEVPFAAFSKILLTVVGINFSPQLVANILKVLDDDSSGSIDYRKFCENLMGSNKRSLTSMTDNAAQAVVSDDAGNSSQFLRRKVRMSWKPLIAAFKHESDKEGNLTPQQLRDVLFRFDIIIADKQYAEMVQEMDEDGDGQLSYQEFLQYFAVGSEEDKAVMTVIKGMSIPKAKDLVRDKLRGRLTGGPAEIRRSFQFFDRDGSGEIDLEEFGWGLEHYCGLVFEQEFLKRLMGEFDDGSGEITYQSFAELVMESSASDVAGVAAKSKAKSKKGRPLSAVLTDIQQRADSKSSNLRVIFRGFDEVGSGNISHQEFFRGLAVLGVRLIANEQRLLLKKLDKGNTGLIDYNQFADEMKAPEADAGDTPAEAAEPQPVLATDDAPASEVGDDGGSQIEQQEEVVEDVKTDQQPVAVVGQERPRASPQPAASAMAATGIGQAGQTIAGIKEFVIRKVEAKSSKIAAVFRKFDVTKRGTISLDEFRKGLLNLGIPLDDREFAMLAREVDNDGGGQIDYREFVEDMKDDEPTGALIGEHEGRPRPAAIAQDDEPSVEAKGIGISDGSDIRAYIVATVEGRSPPVQDVMRNFDADGGGRLSYADFRRALLLCGIPLNDSEMAELMRHCDVDQTGSVAYMEFLGVSDVPPTPQLEANAADVPQDTTTGIGMSSSGELVAYVKARLEATGASLASLFAKFDGGRENTVGTAEVRAALLRAGIPLNDAEFAVLIDAWDPAGTGSVSYDDDTGDIVVPDNIIADVLEPEPEPRSRPSSMGSRGSLGSRASQVSRASRGSRASRASSPWRATSPGLAPVMETVPEGAASSGMELVSKLADRVSDAKRRSSMQASGSDAALAAMMSKGGNRRKPSLADYGSTQHSVA